MHSNDNDLAHLIEGRQTDADGAPAPEIVGSWRRCIEEYHLDPDSQLKLPRLTEHEVRERREQLDELLAQAGPVFNNLRHISRDAGYSLLITDARGVIVQAYEDSTTSRDLAAKGMAPGSVWSEDVAGTNGLGTCLATGKAITVYAGEHFGRPLHPFSCSTAPLISPEGTILGALDISTYAQGSKHFQGLALNLVCEAADEVEAHLFKQVYARDYLVTLSPSADVTTLPATAVIAIDGRGRIIGATSKALIQLQVPERSMILGQPLSLLLGMPLEPLFAACGSAKPMTFADGRLLFASLTQPTASVTAPPASHASRRPSPARRQPEGRTDSPLYRAAGTDPQLLKNADICHRVLDRGISILLQGETGAGKEVWSRAIHDSSARKDKPFVTLNCAAIPESLIESELFGYGSGAFTGAAKGGKIGKIQASDGGTLFLDEIGDMPLELQARLLRVLAEREVTPVGQVKPIPVDIHVICATHRNLREYVQRGEFREDLYYRISGVNITLPALRERQDKAELIDRILQELASPEAPTTLSMDALNVLLAYPWPGNVRQLKNVLHYALCMRESDQIGLADLPDEIFEADLSEAPPASTSQEDATVPPQRMVSLPHEPQPVSSPLHQNKEEAERTCILQALEENRWVVTRTAKAMGISRATLHRKIKKYGLLSPNQRSTPT